MTSAHDAAETVDVEDVRLGLHDEVIACEARLTLGTATAEQPA